MIGIASIIFDNAENYWFTGYWLEVTEDHDYSGEPKRCSRASSAKGLEEQALFSYVMAG